MINDNLPPMSPLERHVLECEAGHPFLSDLQAYQYLIRRTEELAVNRMLNEVKSGIVK